MMKTFAFTMKHRNGGCVQTGTMKAKSVSSVIRIVNDFHNARIIEIYEVK